MLGRLPSQQGVVPPTLVGCSTELAQSKEGFELSPVAAEEPVQTPQLRRTLRCITVSAGILLTLCVYGILQERIMSVPYGTEYFESSIFLVFCNRLVSTLAGMAMASLRGESLAMAAPAHKFCLVSVTNCAAAFCQYEALKWVSFPIQVLGKSFKLVPVMLWSGVINHKDYKASDWAVALVVSLGVFCFLSGGSIAATHRQEENGFYGILLLAAFLALDSFTSTFQEKLFRDHAVTKANQMLHVNSFSILLSFVALLASRGALSTVQFSARHARLPADTMALSVASASSQFFILSMVKEFGALALAAAMNVRQLLSVLLSYWLYGHAVAPLQVVGLVLVFAPLLSKCTWRLLGTRKQSVPDEGAESNNDKDEFPPQLDDFPKSALPTDEEPEPEK